MEKGDSREVTLYLNGISYKAKLNNNKIDKRFGNYADIIQIRYTKNRDLAKAFQSCFQRNYAYIKGMKEQQSDESKKHIILPDDYILFIKNHLDYLEDCCLI